MRSIATIALFVAMIATASAEPVTTYRNEKGQVTGYGERRGSTTTYTNERGQEIGRATRQRDGSTIYFDASGRQVGTSKARR